MSQHDRLRVGHPWSRQSQQINDDVCDLTTVLISNILIALVMDE
jgi:hypothetical protein